ncbi:type II toxin-antitoxin system PemK/MazF family toxin [Candidatus Shapirobacteria bacterium]|nr:type II toxin-antitoxin system PemK/MazF family toxin [Candidatus Shapirobacteria bacterium]
MYKVVLVKFPYIEKTKFKIRPGILLSPQSWGKHKLIVVAYITSQPPEKIATEILIAPTKKNGLRHKSVIRLHKLATVSSSVLFSEIGCLTPAQSSEVKNKLRQMFDI